MWPAPKRRIVQTTKFREMPVNDLVGCRDMELLCRRRAALDTQHSWMWLGEAERWRDLAHRENCFSFSNDGSRSNGQGSEYDRRRLPNLIGKEPEAGL
jgi:hypothetical protein